MARISDSLDECRKLLEEYRALLMDCLHKGDQEDDPGALMLTGGFDFGIRTLGGMVVLIEADEDNVLLACTLCRPFFETAVRLLWAARTHNGWQRLQVHWANEDVKWAREAEQIPSVAEHAKTIRTAREKVLSRTDEDGNRVEPPPNMQQMLREIEVHDVGQGLRKECDGAAESAYTNVYRILCQAAHGHMVAIGRPGSFRRHARCGALMATSALLQACCHVVAGDAKREIEAAGQRVMAILEEGRDE